MLDSKYPTLSRPPIQVAIFQIGFESEVDFNPNVNTLLSNLFKETLPKQSHNINRNIFLDKITDDTTSVKLGKPQINELRYISGDDGVVLSITDKLFTLNITKGYAVWQKHIDEFKNLWNIYNTAILKKRFTVNRASTRFINRIEIENVTDPSEFFNTTIYAPENIIPGDVDNFTLKYITKIDSIRELHVLQGFESKIGSISPYVFDIDVIALKSMNDDDLWDIFASLQPIKNTTFFSNLTDKTLNLLK